MKIDPCALARSCSDLEVVLFENGRWSMKPVTTSTRSAEDYEYPPSQPDAVSLASVS